MNASVFSVGHLLLLLSFIHCSPVSCLVLLPLFVIYLLFPSQFFLSNSATVILNVNGLWAKVNSIEINEPSKYSDHHCSGVDMVIAI